MKNLKGAEFQASALRIVAPAPPPDDPPLAVGDWCRLNSGSPALLVVDADNERVVCALPGGDETPMIREIVRRNGAKGR